MRIEVIEIGSLPNFLKRCIIRKLMEKLTEQTTLTGITITRVRVITIPTRNPCIRIGKGVLEWKK